MKIAFDLDDTLIPGTGQFPTERHFGQSFWRPFFPEPLRKGSVTLFKILRRAGHGIWIYTTSQRPAWYLKLWFWLLGISLAVVVNLERHKQMMQACPYPANTASKYPPAFGIDLLVDNSEGVVLEGQRYDFAVLHVSPEDTAWTETVLREITDEDS